MNYAQMRRYDIANGDGIGCTLFISGCDFHCKGCFNKEYQNFSFGNVFDEKAKNEFIKMCNSPNVDHVSILGGDPFCQNPVEIYNLLYEIKEKTNKKIWLWTGYKYEKIPDEYSCCFEFIDYLIDGQFIEELKDIRLKYRGSSNQRIIDIKQTITTGNVVLWKYY